MMRLRYEWLIRKILEDDVALHKQMKKKKQYPEATTLYPGWHDKLLIHYDAESKCWRVTHYSKFGEVGKRFRGLVKTKPTSPWRRASWTYQRMFENEVAAIEFAKKKAEERKFDRPVFLLQLDV